MEIRIKKILVIAVCFSLSFNCVVYLTAIGTRQNHHFDIKSVDLIPSPQIASDNLEKLDSSQLISPTLQRWMVWPDDPYRIQIATGAFSTSLEYRWQEFQSVVDIWSGMAPGFTDKLPQYRWLDSQGIKLSGTFWPFGELGPLEFCYNSTYRATQFASLQNSLNQVPWINLMDRITLDDEAPASSYQWCSFSSPVENWPEIILKFNSTYFEETGYTMKGTDQMDRMEYVTFMLWLNNRTASAMNYAYDWFKTKNPNWKVGWCTMGWPGYEPVLVKADFRMGGTYSTKFRETYSPLRYYATNCPESQLIGLSWGEEIWGDGVPVGADLDSNFWASYLAGAQVLTQFQFNWLDWDIPSQNTWDHLVHLYNQARSMPIWNATPLILEVSDEWGLSSPEAAGLVEFDVTTQFVLNNTDFDLSKYNVVVLRSQIHLWENVAKKLNEFVQNGGSVVLIGRSCNNKNEWGTQRMTSLEFEKAGGDFTYSEYFYPADINLDGQNALSAVWDYTIAGRTAMNFTHPADFTVIPINTPEENSGQFPIVMYHNTTNPKAGYWFLDGIHVPALDFTYTTPLTAFLTNILHQIDGVAQDGWLYSLISTSHVPKALPTNSIPNYNTIESEIYAIGTLNEIPSIYEWKPWTVNVSAHGAAESSYYMYNGPYSSWRFNTEAGLNQGLLSGGTTVAKDEISFTWLAPSTPGPDFLISIVDPPKFPVEDEILPLTLNITNFRMYENAQDCELKVQLAEGIQLCSADGHSINPDPSTTILNLGEINGLSSRIVHLWMRGTKIGQAHINVWLNASNIIYPINGTYEFQIWPGRLRVSLKGDSYITPGDTWNYEASILYEGTNKLDYFTTDELFCRMMFGNPGGLKNYTSINPGQTIIQSGHLGTRASEMKAGDIGLFKLWCYDDDYIWGESYQSVGVVNSLLDIIPIDKFPFESATKQFATALIPEPVRILLSVRGLDTAFNIRLNWSCAGNYGNNDLIPMLTPNSTYIWNCHVLAPVGVSTVTFEASAENIPIKTIITMELEIWLLEPFGLILLTICIGVVIWILYKSGYRCQPLIVRLSPEARSKLKLLKLAKKKHKAAPDK